MQINYFEGRIRVRDKALRDGELRARALKIAEKLCAVQNVEYNEKTASVLIEYAPESVDKTLIEAITPSALKLRRLLDGFGGVRKEAVFAELDKIEAAADAAGAVSETEVNS
ncbi:MAG: HMA2 domain-containing protein [Treponema sp.]